MLICVANFQLFRYLALKKLCSKFTGNAQKFTLQRLVNIFRETAVYFGILWKHKHNRLKRKKDRTI
jgi:hypothetical protein